MADKNTDLQQVVKQQEEQIRTLKQALIRLERKVQAISKVADRANHASRRATEDLRVLRRKLGDKG